jgi:predicted PurR-regulated permease PerM
VSALGELVKKHRQLILFTLGLLFIFLLLCLLLNVLLPFIAGFVLAYQLLPIIRAVEKRLPGLGKHRQLKRIAVISVIYLLALAVVVLLVLYVLAVMGKSLLALTQNAPQIIPNGLNMLKPWLKSIPLLSPPSVQAKIDVLVLQAGVSLSSALNNFLLGGVELVKSASGMLLGFAIMPIFTFFILKDWSRLRDGFYGALPAWSRKHARSVFSIVQNVTGRYIRGQLLLGLILGVCTGALLFILGVDFALPLAIFAGLMVMVPMIGPYLGAGLGILVTLSTAPEKVIPVAIGYLVFSLLENNLLVPRIQGSQMEIQPALIILLGFLGAYFAGILGFIIILPLAMTISGIFKYLRDSSRDGAIL